MTTAGGDPEPDPREGSEEQDLERHRQRAKRYQAEREDPRGVKRAADSGTGDRSTATARVKAD